METDLRQVFRYLARADGRKSLSFRPAFLGLLRDEEEDRWRFAPNGNASLLGRFFAEKNVADTERARNFWMGSQVTDAEEDS